MAATTTLLGLVTPTQGTLTGTWGDTVNYGISDYLDIAIAGTLSFAGDGAITLANTTGSSSGNSIGATTAQYAIIRVTGTLTTAKIITGPSYSKTYLVVNAATGSTVTFKASGQTGVSIAVGETALVYYNGTDYVKVVGTATAGAAGGSTTQVQYNNAGVLAGITGATSNGTALTLVAPVLGTPASGTVTNLTGTASININGTVGATTATTGAFTTVGASGTITQTATAATNTQAMLLTGATTGAHYIQMTNTSASALIGVEGSAGGFLSTGGSPFALQLRNTTGKDVQIAPDGTVMSTFSSTGLAVTGTLSATGNISSTAGGFFSTRASGNSPILDLTQTGVYTWDLINTATTGLFSIRGNTTPFLSIASATGAVTIPQTLGVTGVSTLTGGAVVQGLTVGLGGGAISTSTAVGVSALNGTNTAGSNVAVGYQALVSSTSGAFNTALGTQTGFSTTGSSNTFVGDNAGSSVSSGSSNTAVGRQAGSANAGATGSNNSSLGYQALFSNTAASENTAVGYQSLYTQTTAGTGSNTALGYQAGYTTNGYYNTFLGYGAGRSSTGNENTWVGHAAGYSATTGGSNTGVGVSALQANTASNNTAVGYQAGYTNSTGAKNTYLGAFAGYTSNAAADAFNVCVGYATGYALTTATYNSFFGQNAGAAINSGSKNTIIGRYDGNQGGLDIRTASNYIVLSDGDGNPLISTANSQTVALKGAVPNSGTGITFPASDSPSSDANTLDDYQEGTWTPAVTFGGGATGVAYGVSNGGTYTKVGRIVTVCGILDLTSKGSSTGSISITGLPFSGSNFGGAALTLYGLTFTGQAYGQPNGSAMVLFQILAGTRTALTDTAFANDTSIAIQITYYV